MGVFWNQVFALFGLTFQKQYLRALEGNKVSGCLYNTQINRSSLDRHGLCLCKSRAGTLRHSTDQWNACVLVCRLSVRYTDVFLSVRLNPNYCV